MFLFFKMHHMLLEDVSYKSDFFFAVIAIASVKVPLC